MIIDSHSPQILASFGLIALVLVPKERHKRNVVRAVLFQETACVLVSEKDVASIAWRAKTDSDNARSGRAHRLCQLTCGLRKILCDCSSIVLQHVRLNVKRIPPSLLPLAISMHSLNSCAGRRR